jgi:hypothetical protein
MTGRWLVVGAWNLSALIVSPLGAQSAPGTSGVPDGFKPPAGMCRIWIDGVPADRQPAPTDCATAVRRRPANAHVVFGDQPSASVSTPGQGNPAPVNASSVMPASAAPLSVHETPVPEAKPEIKSEPHMAGIGGGPTPNAAFGTGAPPPAFIVHTAPRPAVHPPAAPAVVRQPAGHGGAQSAPSKSTATPAATKPPPHGH